VFHFHVLSLTPSFLFSSLVSFKLETSSKTSLGSLLKGGLSLSSVSRSFKMESRPFL